VLTRLSALATRWHLHLRRRMLPSAVAFRSSRDVKPFDGSAGFTTSVSAGAKLLILTCAS
jgi:hypothetical protein